MTDVEDLRGRQFGWYVSPDSALETILFEDPLEVGRLTRVPDLQPTFYGELAGRRLRIDHSIGVLGPSFTVRETDSGELLLRSHYTREGEMTAQAGRRFYRLRRSGGVAVWNDDEADAVSLRGHEAFVLMGADPRDAAPLVLLGVVMAIENTLFHGK